MARKKTTKKNWWCNRPSCSGMVRRSRRFMLRESVVERCSSRSQTTGTTPRCVYLYIFVCAIGRNEERKHLFVKYNGDSNICSVFYESEPSSCSAHSFCLLVVDCTRNPEFYVALCSSFIFHGSRHNHVWFFLSMPLGTSRRAMPLLGNLCVAGSTKAVRGPDGSAQGNDSDFACERRSSSRQTERIRSNPCRRGQGKLSPGVGVLEKQRRFNCKEVPGWSLKAAFSQQLSTSPSTRIASTTETTKPFK